MDMERGGPVHVHTISRIASRGKRRHRLRDGCNRQLDEERRRARARRQPVSKGPATRRRSQQPVGAADESQLQEIPSTEHARSSSSVGGTFTRSRAKPRTQAVAVVKQNRRNQAQRSARRRAVARDVSKAARNRVPQSRRKAWLAALVVDGLGIQEAESWVNCPTVAA